MSGRGENRRVEAILFDLDGVLIDSFEAWLGAVNDLRRDLELEAITREHLGRIFGQGVSDDVNTLYPGCTVAEIRARYDEAMPRHVPSMTLGIETHRVLERLGELGIRRAVVTNTQGTLVDQILAHLGIDARVDAVRSAGRGLPEKPEPDMLLDALRQLGVEPSRARMVGDTDYDERAAVAAGVPFIHFDLREGGSLEDALAAGL